LKILKVPVKIMNNVKEKCLFCLIVDKKVDANILIEEADSIAFLDINPMSKGHALIVTKKHYDNLFQIDQED
jgi:histidine triad (HIT) family protein